MPSVTALVDSRGRRRYQDWFDQLDASAAAKVQAAVERMEDGNFGDHKSVGQGVIE